MKKLSLLLLLPIFLFSCSSDDKEVEPKELPNEEPTQDYTSFVFEAPSVTDYILENCVAGYYTKDGLCKKIADLGNINLQNPSKEITVTNDTLVNVYFFADILGTKRFKPVYKLEKNKKNIFKISENTTGIEVDKEDPKQYPH